ncbi:hypothetical protein HZS_6584 [Henneguya salminicola]|nr:hypothetical protein HZS_6584 [Henneguya salminicola]
MKKILTGNYIIYDSARAHFIFAALFLNQMNNRELQIKGSISILEKKTKELKLTLNSFMGQRKLCQKSGVRLYDFQSPMVNGVRLDQNSRLQNLYATNLSNLNSIKTEIERINLYLCESMESCPNTTEIKLNTGETSLVTPTPSLSESRNYINNSISGRNPTSILKPTSISNTNLSRPTTFKNIPISSYKNITSKNSIMQNSFRQPPPKFVSTSNGQNSTFKYSVNVNNPNNNLNLSRQFPCKNAPQINFGNGMITRSKTMAVPSKNYSTSKTSLKCPLSGSSRFLIEKSSCNSIPKPSLNSCTQPYSFSQRLKNVAVKKEDPSNNNSQSGVHSIDSSKLPLGNIEKMLTPIQKPKKPNRSISNKIDENPYHPIMDIPKPSKLELVNKRKTEEFIKLSEMELSRIKDVNENIDPQILEKLGDETLAECYAILGRT